MQDGYGEFYENLAMGIVRQAVADYKLVLKKIASSAECSGTAKQKRAYKAALFKEITELREFFSSDWFEQLTDLDGTLLQKRVEALVRKELHQKVAAAKKKQGKVQERLEAGKEKMYASSSVAGGEW